VLGRVKHEQVQASQRRIVAASEAERRRIERDLHDGAQQRLVSVALHLRVAIARADPDLATTLAAAEIHIRDGLAHLRRLAHGMFPGALTDEGLAAALEELVASACLTNATLRTDVHPEPTPSAALAAYTTVAAAIAAVQQAPDQGTLVIEARGNGRDLLVRVETNIGSPFTMDPDFIDAADRVGAAGGRLDLTRTGPATVITAVIPCAS
jgi:signal transduction histidine kinase